MTLFLMFAALCLMWGRYGFAFVFYLWWVVTL